MSEIVPSVELGIQQIHSTFPSCELTVQADDNGGAFVRVGNIPLGPPFKNSTIWIGFQITFQYPHADVYPHFTTPELTRLDNQDLGQGYGKAAFQGSPALQISRRSNNLNPQTDTAALKLQKVIRWMKSES